MPKPPGKKSVLYPTIHAVLRAEHTKEGPLTQQDCKDLIGWQEVPESEKTTNDFVLKDLYGKKIRLTHNPSNRPFKLPLADRYSNEHLRAKWELNLESIVVDQDGCVLQGQHRLVGFILAEQARQINPRRWGKIPLKYETLIGYGVKGKLPYDLGAKRSLDDVIYRHQQFKKTTSEKEQRKVSKVLAGAIRLVWLRVGGKQISFAPHFPHTEAIEFYGKHPKILQAVTEIVEMDSGDEGGERNISSLLSLSYAAALHYLLTKADSDAKSKAFWESFASGEGLTKGSPILVLRQLLVKTNATSGSKRDEVVGAVIKTWHLWLADKPATTKDIKVIRRKEGDKFVLAEFPRIGGIDSPIEISVELTKHQIVILSILRDAGKKEMTFKDISELSGLQVGTLSTAIMKETRQGESIPYSLISRELVQGNQYEPEKGRAVFMFSLTEKGKKLI